MNPGTKFLSLAAACCFLASEAAAAAPRLRVLFLGDKGHHKPADRFKEAEPALASRGFDLTYTENLADLNPARLSSFDALIIYANHTAIAPQQEQALMDYVARGGGFVPIHCASYCFLNSAKYVELVGAQFKSHGTGVFRDTITHHEHPVMKGVEPIESWDETYVHAKHNANRIVLAERRDEKGAEPYTWVRQHGKGRVFYTAWGHDQRTWGNPQFLALLENGIRWAAEGREPELAAKSNLPPLQYTNAPFRIPNYVSGARWGTMGEAFNEWQMALSPEESARRIVVPKEFEVKLWAHEPDIFKPICMAWDEGGRLWIAETMDYPNELQPPGQGRDRISICEDTDGDGKADKFTVFADKLSIPTGMVFAQGGLIVTAGGDSLLLKDTNGDDKADERRVLLTGWSMGDTHATASNLRYGFDNWIWGTVGYSGFDGVVGGKRIRFSQGVFRFKPDGSAIEFVRSSNNNTWGLGLSEDNIVLGSTANNNASFYMPIPNRYYEAVGGWSASRMETIADSQAIYPITKHVRQVDSHGKFTAAAGHALYTARNYPREYWNAVAWVTEPTAHLIAKFRIAPNGADFTAYNERTWFASDDEWTAPIMAEVGPDGQVWVLDWYNYIVQHNPTPAGFKTGKGNAYESPLRDKRHGRIYRVVWKEARPSGTRSLAKATPEELVNALKDDNQLWRMTAQRLLVERGQLDRSLEVGLIKLVREGSVDETGLNAGAIHALWTLRGLGGLDSAYKIGHVVAREALTHRSAGVRRAALTVLREHMDADLILSKHLLADADAQVRMAAFLALADLSPSSAAGPAILEALKSGLNSGDRWIPHAATAAAARNDASFLKAVLGTVTAPADAGKPSEANAIINSSFEEERDGRPLTWTTATHSGRGEFNIGAEARSGARSAQIRSSAGGDISWSQRVAVQPDTSYRLSAWIKTDDVRGAMGALLNVHELQGAQTVRTKAVTGTTDWSQVQVEFNSGDHKALTINCLFGGWGRSTGTAWFDDVKLTALGGPSLPGALGTVVRVVTGHYAQRAPADSVVPTLLALNGASASLALPLLDGLAQHWPREKAPELSAAEETKLVALMKSLPEEARGSLLTLAERWGRKNLFAAQVEEIAKGLHSQVLDDKLQPPQRADAARRLVAVDDSSKSAKVILSPISPLANPLLVSGLLNALSESRQKETAVALIEAFSKFTPAARRSAISVLLRRPEWAAALVGAVEAKQLQRGDLAAEHWAQLKASPDRQVAEKSAELDKAASASSADMEAIIKKLMPVAQRKGDATRGKEIYKQACVVCHTFNGEGAKIGPDLTGIGARPRADFFVDIIDPNRSVEANYRLWNITTKDGETYAGRLDSETQTSVDILDSAGQKHTLQRKDITEMQASNLSIMPAGFEQLPEDDLAGLLEYLSSPAH